MNDERRKRPIAKALCASRNNTLSLGVGLAIGTALWLGTGNFVWFPVFVAVGLAGNSASACLRNRKDRNS